MVRFGSVYIERRYDVTFIVIMIRKEEVEEEEEIHF